MKPSFLVRLGAGLCFLAVALGAFGAHTFRQIIEGNGLTEVWRTAAFYHFIHAIALFALGLFGAVKRGPVWLFVAGIFVFSGSLYLMALTNLRWLGAITPIGGLCFLAGWAWLVFFPPTR